MAATRVEFNIRLPIKLVKKAKWYVASCPVLDVFSQGNTKKEARDNLSEALSLFLMTCFEEGTLDTVLKGCGFQLAKTKLRKLAHPPEYLNIPIPLIAKSAGAKSCHA